MAPPVLFSALEVVLVFTLLPAVHTSEEHKCPSNQFYLFPCRCVGGGFKGLDIVCDNANLASISLAIMNIKSPMNSVVISNSNISRLFGPIFKDKSISVLTIDNSNLEQIDEDCLGNIKESIRAIELKANRLVTIPESINTAFSSNLTRLTVTDTPSVVELKANVLKKLTNLIELDLHNNSIRKIDSSAFSTLGLLESLDLSRNNLNKLERNLLRPFKKLKYLDLSYNQFKEIGKSDLNELVSVTTLNISHNQLQDLPRSIFSRVSQLKTLDLSGNRFKQIDSYLLRGVRFLKEFHASHNEIAELAKNSFTSTTRIKTIDLSHNNLSEIETEVFKDMQWLDTLDLSHNNITQLKRGTFQKMFKIAILLSHNNLESIEYKSFQELSNITELDLSHNRISSLKANIFEECDVCVFRLNDNFIANLSHVDIFTNLTGMRYLNLSHNKIKEIGRKHFTTKKLYELNMLDLSHNNICELSGNVFERFVSIRAIDLSYNRLTKLGYSAFGSIPTLLELDISHNQVKEISNGGVSSLLSVKTIYVNDNLLESMFPISMAVNAIHAQRNRINLVRASNFPVINALLELYLDHNNLSSFDDDTFSRCLSLNTLSLSHNRFENVPQRALAPLISLQNLDLANNLLSQLGHQAFGSLRILFNLQLSENRITNISDNAFQGLLQLLQLNASHNAIEHIRPDVFNTMVSLHTLDLSFNGLTTLDNSTHSIFAPLLSLERLNLSSNRISLIRDRSFPYSPWIPYKLKHLDLSFNTIPLLTSHFDNGLSRLEWLSVRGNILNEIHTDTLGNLTNLRHLDLSANDLRRLGRGVFRPPLTKLEHLNLSHNKISQLTIAEINEMKALKMLDLQFNRLTNIDPGLFGQIKTGLALHFQGNHVYCECKLMPLVSWIYSDKFKQELEGRESSIYSHWSSLKCSDPNGVKGQRLVDVRANVLDCSDAEKDRYAKQFVGSTPIKIRIIEKFRKRRQDSIKIVWFVQSRIDDIAGFQLLLSRATPGGETLVNETISYIKRDHVMNALPGDVKHTLCIFPIDSNKHVHANFVDYCVTFTNAPTDIVFHHSQDNRVTDSSPLERNRASSIVTAHLFFFLLFLQVFNIF